MLPSLNNNYKKYLFQLLDFIFVLALVIIFLAVIILLYKLISYFAKQPVLLLVSSDVVKNISEIKPYLLDKVHVVIYDYDNTNNFSDIIELVKKYMRDNNIIANFSNVGIMFDIKKEYTMSLFKRDHKRKVLTGHEIVYDNIDVYNDFLLFCEYLSTITGAKYIDIISGSVIPKVNKNIFTLLSVGQTKFRINISITNFGGRYGNWYLEQGNVELIGLYFNEKIDESHFDLNYKN
jgi:hypothetical protein